MMTDLFSTFSSDLFGRQSAAVTGGSGGIGRATALALARLGANVAGGYRRSQQEADDACRQAAANGANAVPIQVDVMQTDQVHRFMEQAVEAIGPLDMLINCAGTWPEAMVYQMEDQEWTDTIATNLYGTYYTCKVASKLMTKRRSGRIVNFSSITTDRGARTSHAHYATEKAGVSAFTRSLAYELAPYNVTVNSVAPGMIRTKITGAALKQREEQYLEQIPLSRIGSPDEVASLVVYLVSPPAAYITGQVIHVNGGMWMS